MKEQRTPQDPATSSRRRMRLLLAVGGFAVLSIAAYLILLEPAMDKLSRAQERLNQSDLRLEQARQLLAKEPELKAELARVRRRASIRSAQEVVAELVKFLETARAVHGTNTSYKAVAESDVSGLFRRTDLEIDGDATPAGLVHLLSHLTHWDEYFDVERMAIKTAERDRIRVTLGCSILAAKEPVPVGDASKAKGAPLVGGPPDPSALGKLAQGRVFGIQQSAATAKPAGPSIPAGPPAARRDRGVLYLRGIYLGSGGRLKGVLEDRDTKEVHTVAVGDSVAGYVVDALEDERLVLSRGPETVRLQMGDHMVIDRKAR